MKTLLLPLLAAAAAAQTPAPMVDLTQLTRDARALAENLRTQTIGNISVNGQTLTVLSRMNIGPTVTGAPYSAEAVNESIQVLQDGNRIVSRTSTKIYRDSEGRERR